MSDVPMKRCTKCGEEKPATREYFCYGTKVGLKQPCRECSKREKREDYHNKKAHICTTLEQISDPPKKKCIKCGNEYPDTKEFFNWGMVVGVIQPCRNCLNKYARERRRKPPKEEPIVGQCPSCGKTLPNTREYFTYVTRRQEGIRKCRYCLNHLRRQKAYFNSDIPDQKQCSKCGKTYPNTKAYFKWHKRDGITNICKICYNAHRIRKPTDPIVAKAITLRRVARKLKLPDNFTSRDWKYALSYFGGCCAVCGRHPGLWHTLAADHWIPLKSPDCPGTTRKNIVPLCHGVGGCNNSKHDRPAEKWLIDKFGKRKANQIIQRIQAYFDSLPD